MALQSQRDQDKEIDMIHATQEEDRVREQAQEFGIPYINLMGIGISTDALRLVPEAKAREAFLAPFKMVGKTIYCAIKNPNDSRVASIVTELKSHEYEPVLYLASTRSLEKAWERYGDISLATRTKGSFLDVSDESLQEITEQVKNNEDIQRIFLTTQQEKTSRKISRLLEIMFGSAIATKSSDIHIEPQEASVRIRFRQDGILQDITAMDHATYKTINSRIKLLSEMKLTTTSEAQDGRFTINYKGTEIEIRTSVVPSAYGEGIVMRILNPEGISVGFDELGIEPELLKILEKEIAKPNGLILTTGPTGSGKTTTLYSFLKKVYSPDIKIMTIEDPIEYHLQGISQTQVEHEKGYDFLAGLRAALRQDPDVIMVGEIRDKETATIAVNASLTGHLVLSTLHTNNASGAIPRLLDLGVKPGILASALTVSMAQRLVRKLCTYCKQIYQPNPDDVAILKKVLAHAQHMGKDISRFALHPDQDIIVYEPKGCEKCNFTGYKGRIGLYEAILTDSHIEKLLMKGIPTEREVYDASQHQGIFTMQEDGVIKIVQGITSIAEVRSVVDLLHGIDDQEENDTEKTIPETISQAQDISKNISPSSAPEITYSPISESMISVPHSYEQKIQVLIEYLDYLEHQQQINPEKNINEKIRTVEHMIIDILRQKDGVILQKNPEHIIRDEITLLMNDLQHIQQHKQGHADMNTAEQLQTIRKTIEKMIAQ